MKILIIAEAANPEWVSVPLVGWSIADAMRRVADVHIVTQIRNRDAFERAGLIHGKDFTALDSEKVAAPLWKAASMLRGGDGKGWTTTTAISALSYYYFEYLLWKQFGHAISRGEYDIVHRVTPLSPTLPSLLAKKCKRANVHFILGPLNGGVPWPKEFDSARRQEKEWLSYVRDAYKLLPGYHSTLESASAIVVGSKATRAQVPARYQSKCVYVPENAIDPRRFSGRAEPYSGSPLKACFVGRLVPYKGPDMLLEAATPLLREGKLFLDIFGDGPMMPALQDYVQREQLTGHVKLHGWIAHEALQDHLRRSQIFAFPSIREFGGGVVLEAMALGLVPVIVDYAGPAELVTAETGIKVPLGSRSEIVTALGSTLSELTDDPTLLATMALNCIERVRNLFTWEAKAAQLLAIYQWVIDGGKNKPRFLFCNRE